MLSVLRSPAAHLPLHLEDVRIVDGEVESGWLATPASEARYQIVNFVPRFVAAENYAENFGLEWNLFRRTQLDSHSGRPISKDRFYRFTGWTPEELSGKRVLDVGCGAGRFTEVALEAGANVIALDYSAAVDACWANHRLHPRLDVVQGDIYRMPFRPEQFDYVYCLGVLQHTPDVRRAFLALPDQLRPGGFLAVDVYPKLRLNPLLPRYWLRPLTRRLPPETLFRIVRRALPALLPVSNAVGQIPRVGRRLRHAIPVANYRGEFDLSAEQLREWAVLDTFDWFSPRYDQPQSAEDLLAWFREGGLSNVWVGRLGFLVGRGRKRSGE